MTDQLLEIKIPAPLYDRLQREAERRGMAVYGVILEAIHNYCHQVEDMEQWKQELKQELKAYVQSLLAEKHTTPTPKPEIPPSIRPLQVGDLVQIRDRDSPFYLQTATIVSTTLIRATVDIGSAKHNFLKRDLRYIASPHEPT